MHHWISLFAFIFLVFQFLNHLTPVFAHDEMWFLKIAAKLYADGWEGIRSAVLYPPLFYGSGYWLIQILCRSIAELLPQDFRYLPIRLLGLIAWLTVPWILLYSRRFRHISTCNRTLSFLVYLTLPMSWWTGKITGPESFSVVFGVIGLAVLFGQPSKPLWGASWIGAAIALKLSALPALVYASIHFILIRKFRTLFVILFFSTLSFLSSRRAILAIYGCILLNSTTGLPQIVSFMRMKSDQLMVSIQSDLLTRNARALVERHGVKTFIDFTDVPSPLVRTAFSDISMVRTSLAFKWLGESGEQLVTLKHGPILVLIGERMFRHRPEPLPFFKNVKSKALSVEAKGAWLGGRVSYYVLTNRAAPHQGAAP